MFATSQAFNTSSLPAIDKEYVGQTLPSWIDRLETRMVEQYGLADAMKYTYTTTYMSTEARLDAVHELFLPNVLSTLWMFWSYRFCTSYCVTFCSLLIYLAWRRVLYTSQALLSSFCHSENTMGIAASSALPKSGDSGSAVLQSRPFWSLVDNVNKRFTGKEKDTEPLAESPNLKEVRESYTTD